MSNENQTSDQKELNPLSDAEFAEFLEGMSGHLEHAALKKCWTILGIGYSFINNLIQAQIERGAIDRAPKGVEMLLDDMREAIEFGRPFVEEEETKEESDVRE